MIQRAWWPVVHVVAATLAVMSVALLPAQLFQAPKVAAMENFGSKHQTYTWVIAAPPSEVDEVALTATLLEIAQRYGLSFAYSPDPEVGVVHVFDPSGLFGLGQPVYASLAPHSHRVMFSRALARLDGTEQAVIPDTDRFYGEAPAMAVAVEEGALGPGYFLFTGPSEVDWETGSAELESCWERFRLDVVFKESRGPATVWSQVASAKLPALIIAGLFVLVPWAALLLLAQLRVAAARGVATCAAVAGATARQLFRQLFFWVGGTALLGTVLGALSSCVLIQTAGHVADPVMWRWSIVASAAGGLGTLCSAALSSVVVVRQVKYDVVC